MTMFPSLASRSFQLERYDKNPVLAPLEGSSWESRVTTNPGAWYDEVKREVFMIYRAAGDDEQHHVHLGLAVSKDGYRFERVGEEPILSPLKDGIDGGCIEDPRIVKIGDWFFVTAATRPFPPGQYWLNNDHHAETYGHFPAQFPVALRENLTSTHLYLTRNFKSWIRAGRLTNPKLDDRDVVIFPEQVGEKWVTLHRPMQWHGEGFENGWPSIWIAKSADLLEWKDMHLLAKGVFPWENKIGANNPPLKTEHGWLLIYHGVGNDKQYRLGAFLLDLEDPAIVTHRTPEPIYEPVATYEKEGLYEGVCFPCGHAVIDGTYFLYYGGGDIYCCVATTPLQDLLNHLLENPVLNV